MEKECICPGGAHYCKHDACPEPPPCADDDEQENWY